MDYRMPRRSLEPLDTQWDGDLYAFVEYSMDRVQEVWRWDDPAHAATMAADLTPQQLAVWAILNADGQVCNGGFSQFFYNSYGELAEEALQGFHLLGMQECAAIFEQAYAAFAQRPIPKDREQRILMLEQLGEDEDSDAGASGTAANNAAAMLAHYSALAKGTEELWGELESRYYGFIHRKGVRGGYNAAFFSPLATYIDAHPDAFFLPEAG